jgi:hypothetical protein
VPGPSAGVRPHQSYRPLLYPVSHYPGRFLAACPLFTKVPDGELDMSCG